MTSGTLTDEIKRRLEGRWKEALQVVGGIPAEFLHFDTREGPCPKCGGDTRFRGIDERVGAMLCSHCFRTKNGDGFAATMWYTGWDFLTTIKRYREFLGMQSAADQPRKTSEKKKDLFRNIRRVPEEQHDACLLRYSQAKPPITVAGLNQCRGRPASWNDLSCIAFTGSDSPGAERAAAVVLVRDDGSLFPATGKLLERKTHSTGGSHNSWLCSGTAEELHSAAKIIDVEGVPDWLAVASVGLPPGCVVVTNTAGCGCRGKLSRPWAKGKQVITIGDCDAPGEEGVQAAAVAYFKAGAAEVLIGKLPYPTEPTKGRDVRDLLVDGHTLAELQTVVVTTQQAAEWGTTKRQSNDREIIVDTNEARVVDQAIEALAEADNVFQRGGCLVHITQEAPPPKGIARPQDTSRITIVRQARIRELLSAAANWLRPTGDDGGVEKCHPPDWAVRAVEARGQWAGIKRIEAVVESPILRADGTILQAVGYDDATGICYQPRITFPAIHPTPTQSDAMRARDELLEAVRDFPFAGESHRSGWVAGTLTPLARYAFAGPAPLTLIDANVRGSGKSLLADVSARIATGRGASRMSMPRDDDETRKRITAIAVAGESVVLIDNINGTLGNASLDAALTATTWSDRILGQTAMASCVPLYTTWYATGNNVILAADTARRTLHVRLESNQENPEERSGFLHANLLEWIDQERPRLTAAALTILAAYCAAGRPDMQLRPWGSFEAWSGLIRNSIVWVGMPDPGNNRLELGRQSDRESMALRQLLEGWLELAPSGAGITVVEALRMLNECPDRYDTLRGAMWELAPPKDGKTFNPRSIGMKLHHLRKRVVGMYYLDRIDSGVGALWSVKTIESVNVVGSPPSSQDTRDTRDTNSAPPTRTRTHTRTHAREAPAATGNSVSSPSSVLNCEHADVLETPTFDGYVNRECRTCGKNLGARKQRPGEIVGKEVA